MRARKSDLLQASLLDRLIDEEPENQASSQRGMAVALRELRLSVRRDIEALLNTRIHWHTWPKQYKELSTSLLTYGLPDFANMPVGGVEGREMLCKKVQDTIKRFEPRFMQVEVTCEDAELPLDRIMRLRIDALLYADPEPELISFNTEVEPVNLEISVLESSL